MDERNALAAFSALGQKTRMDVLRRLIAAGPEGLCVGDLCDRLDVRQNTMSANLSVLLNAGLVRNERRGRNVVYFADLDAIRSIVWFFLEDCCGGNPHLCAGVRSPTDASTGESR